MKQSPTDEQPWDICECGDYRDQHDGGTGRCMFGRNHLPIGECRRFVFASRTTSDEMNWRQGACPPTRFGTSR